MPTQTKKLTDRMDATPILCDRVEGCMGGFNPNCISEIYKRCPWYIEQEENYIKMENKK